MLRVFLSTCALQVAVCIIVTDSPPLKAEYKYSYEIVDPSTGDSKSLREIKNGDVVSGSYSVVDPDGTKRIVDYTADPRTGFKAVVRTEPFADHYNMGLPYSSLYHSQNFNTYQMKKKKFVTSAQFAIPSKNKPITYFSPGRGPSEKKFDSGNFFMPNDYRK